MPAEPSSVHAQGAGTQDSAWDSAVRSAIAHASFADKFRHPVKFNGTDFVETRLSNEEVLQQVASLSRSSPHVFLERYGPLLPRQDLNALRADSAGQTPEACFWLDQLSREPPSDDQLRKRARRRRWLWARREMVLPDGFFCEDAMKRRDPTLFHNLVGRHISAWTQSGTAAVQGGLSSYLMQQLDRACAEDAQAEARTAHAAARTGHAASRGVKRRASTDEEREEDDVHSDEDDIALDGFCGTSEDEVSGRERFLHEMRDRFVNGLVVDFDYATIDEDSDLEDVVELGRDAEERYFDDDDDDA